MHWEAAELLGLASGAQHTIDEGQAQCTRQGSGSQIAANDRKMRREK